MNDSDRDLIIDLLSGSLDPEAAAAAEARIAGSPELSAEVEAQRFALTELATQPKLRLAADERTALRSAIAAELNLDTAAAPVVVAKRRARWWAPVAGLATVAVVFFGFVMVSGELGGSDSADETMLASAAVTTTAAAGEAAAEQEDADVSAPEAGDDGTSEFQATEELDRSVDVPQLITPVLGDAGSVSPTMVVPDFPEGLPAAADLYALLEDSEFALDVFAESLQVLGAEGLATVSTESANLCRTVAGESYDSFHVVAAATPEEELQTASYLFHSAEAADQIVNVAIDSCTVIDSAMGGDS